jgi:hypothetical protein
MRSLLARLFIVMLAGAAAATSTASQAETPRATITYDNKSGQLALVKLIGPSRRTTEVPNHQRRTVTVVGGEYYILTRYGSKRDEYTYAKGDRFHVTQTARRYSIITITLHKVVGGNYGTEPIKADEFEKQ